MGKQRKIPMRICVGCREKKPKRELLRLVRTPENEVKLDLSGKMSGRGAYICRQAECLKKALKGKRLEKTWNILFLKSSSPSLPRCWNPAMGRHHKVAIREGF